MSDISGSFGPAPAGLETLVVAVATYRRQAGLSDLLTSLASQTWGGHLVVTVVDNDPEGSARGTVDSADPKLDVRYLHEPIPGIAAARNRSIADLAQADAALFIDDDEVADPTWIDELVATAKMTGADVVAGPVIPIIPASAPWWIHRYRVYQMERPTTGSPVKWPATNNALVRRSVLDQLGSPHFSEEFSLTGGSDAEFFWRVRAAGFTAVWSDEAIVRETVPGNRLTRRWWWTRTIRAGNVSGRLMVRARPRPVVALIALARMLVGILLGPIGLLNPMRPSIAMFSHLPKGIGTLNSLRGRLVVEYARTQPKP
jgi:succinoglycan biosynthesis protein ExoM